MKNTNKFLNTAIVITTIFFTATNMSAAFYFPSKQPVQPTGFGSFSQPQQAQLQPIKSSFSTPQQSGITFTSNTPQQPQKNLNWNSMEFKDYFQVIKESAETIEKLSGKIAALEETTKAMQSAIDTLKETVAQNYSTSMKMLNEALKK